MHFISLRNLMQQNKSFLTGNSLTVCHLVTNFVKIVLPELN